MQITVKDSKVVKTGTNKSGEWELIRVISEDNTEYTTFDKKVKSLPNGSVIEFEPIIKEGKLSFKDFKVISEAPAKSNGDQMSKEDWADKQRVERTSIENQVRAKLIVELRITGAIDDKSKLYQKCLEWLDKLDVQPKTKKPQDDKRTDTSAVVKQATEEELFAEESSEQIDLDWLKESLETLRAKKIEAWTESNLLTYMKTAYKIESKTVLDCATKLEKGQAAHFVKRVQETLDMV